MSEPRILVRSQPKADPPPHRPAAAVAWRGLAGLGWLLALAGLSDLVLLWIPLRFGLPEWEFATVAATASALPLVTLGLAGVLAEAAARGRRWELRLLGLALGALGLVLVGLLLVFLTNVPMAVRTTAEAAGARLGIVRASIKTVVLAALFGLAYISAAIWSFRLAATTTGRAE